MNYLAHAYLSFGEPGILTGNMISDFVKGKKKFDYPGIIQKGMTLHRSIDEFTDAHEATREAKFFFAKAYRLYAGAFVDVSYDHFLANDHGQFHDEQTLDDFCQATYMQLGQNVCPLPEKFQQMLPYMKEQNWLFNYRLNMGMERSFTGLVRRAAYLSESATAYKIFIENYDALADCYAAFFPELKSFAHSRFIELNN
ncbi:MAG: ACP phosphodiesterase [Bacteroidota bacterium]